MSPGKRIVVADDDRDGADTLAELLRLKGHEVFVAYDGEAVVELVRRIEPDVVLLDLAMPRLDGCQAARRIRAEPAARKLVVVAVTGVPRAQLRRSVDLAGFDFFLGKPVDLSVLDGLLAGSPPRDAVAPPT